MSDEAVIRISGQYYLAVCSTELSNAFCWSLDLGAAIKFASQADAGLALLAFPQALPELFTFPTGEVPVVAEYSKHVSGGGGGGGGLGGGILWSPTPGSGKVEIRSVKAPFSPAPNPPKNEPYRLRPTSSWWELLKLRARFWR